MIREPQKSMIREPQKSMINAEHRYTDILDVRELLYLYSSRTNSDDLMYLISGTRKGF